MFNLLNILNNNSFVMPTIKISQKTFNLLQQIAIPFKDKEPEDVIIRLLKGSGETKSSVKVDSDSKKKADLVSHSGRVPDGSKLRATYKGQEFLAEIRNGKVLWEGREFSSLSRAAVAVIQSTGSDRPTENGWRFWEIKSPGYNKWRSGLKFQNKS